MAKPWEKFQKPAESPGGDAGAAPWKRFAKNEPSDSARLTPEEQGLKPGSLSGVSLRSPLTAAFDLLGGSSEAVGRNALDKATLENARYSKGFRKRVEDDQYDFPASSKAGKAIGLGGVTAGSIAAAPASTAPLLVRALAPSAISAAQAGLSRPSNPQGAEDDLAKRGSNAALAAVLAPALTVTGKGLGKLGDWTMQKAVGSKEYVPGMGTRMADEGLWGWKGFMKKQVADKLPAREAELTEAVRGVRGQVRPGNVARQIQAKADKFVPSSPIGREIAVPSSNQPYVDMANRRSLEAVARGSLTPQEAISTARAVAAPAYNKFGAPLEGFENHLNQTEGVALKNAVKDLADAQGIPGVRSALASEQALLQARNALNRPESLNDAIVRHLIRGGVFGAPAYVAGGPAAGVATYAATTPLGLSSIGRLGTWGDQGTPYLTPTAVDALIRRSQQEEIE